MADPNSIVDYLGTQGIDSSLGNRAKLAVEKGIVKSAADYSGAADQNIALLGALRGSPGKTTDIGIGTLTTIPKSPLTTPVGGTGVTTPATVATPGMPTYPAPKTPQTNITDAYGTFTSGLDDIMKRITAAAAPGSEEETLAKDLATKRGQLNAFDTDTLKRIESLSGQGRGATANNVNLRQDKERRTSALERLGIAQEADTISNLLATTKESRLALGDIAQTEFNLASKKLDIALGVQNQIDKLNDDDKNDARQYLLDVVDFAGGKTYDELDPATQQGITDAAANSPITVGMVKTALQSAKDKQTQGDLRTVAGVGVVQIRPDGTYKVVVPESGNTTTPTNVPTFEQYVESQQIPYPALTPTKLVALHTEYDGKYGGVTVGLGKLTNDQKGELQQAGLSGAPSAVQSYFLNTPTEFQDEWQRGVAAGTYTGKDLNTISSAYTKWYDAKNTKTGTRDWSKIFGGTANTTPVK